MTHYLQCVSFISLLCFFIFLPLKFVPFCIGPQSVAWIQSPYPCASTVAPCKRGYSQSKKVMESRGWKLREIFLGQPNKIEAQNGGKVSFETFLDKPTSHCIGEYLWVHSVWSRLAGGVTMCMYLTPVLLWFLSFSLVSPTQGGLSCLPSQCYFVSHTWPRNEDSDTAI